MDFFTLYQRKPPTLTQRVVFDGLSESVDSLIFHALKPAGPSLVITPDMMQAERLAADLEGLGHDVMVITPKELLTHRIYAQSKDALMNRSRQLQTMLEPDFRQVVITPIKGVAQRLVPVSRMRQARTEIRLGQPVDFDGLLKKLDQLGYQREVLVENRGEFAQRGDIIDIFSIEEDHPVRVELFGDEVDSIRRFDETTQKSLENLTTFHFGPVCESFTSDAINAKLAAVVPEDVLLSEDFALERDRYFSLIGETSTLFDYANFTLITLLEEEATYK